MERASELAKAHSAVSELLGFYQKLIAFQKKIYLAMAGANEHDLGALVPYFTALFQLIEESGSAELKAAAKRLAEASEEDRLELLVAFWQHEAEVRDIPAEFEFFVN